MGSKILNVKNQMGIALLTISSLFFINIFTENLGIIRLAIVTGLFIEVCRRRSPDNGLPFAFVSLSVVSIAWGWLGPFLNGYSNPFAFLIMSLLIVYCLKTAPTKERRITPIYLISSVLLGLFCQFSTWSRLLASLLWGYDNNANISSFAQTYRHGGFLFSGSLPPLFSFSNYYNGYPPLQAGSWSFLLASINTQLTIGSEELIRYFCFFLFGTMLTLCSIFIKNVQAMPFQNSVLMFLYRSGIFSLVFFSQIGFIFWAGFSSFLWAMTTLVAYLSLASNQKSHKLRVIVCILGSLITFYSYQLLAPIAITVLLFEVCRSGKQQFHELIQSWRVWLIGSVSLALMVVFLLKSLNTTDYVFFAGGIEPLALIPLIGTVSIIALTFVFFRSQYGAYTVQISAFTAAVFLYAVLAFISKNHQDYVSYYPEKVGYSALLLGFFALFPTNLLPPRNFVATFIKPTRLFFGFLVLVPLILSFNNTDSKYGYFASSDAIENFDVQVPFEICLIQAITFDHNLDAILPERTSLLLVQNFDSDLMTRWLNSINGLLSDATYSISIPHSNTTELNLDAVRIWLAQFPTSRLTVMAAEEPVNLSTLGPRVDFQPFVCL